MGRVRGVIIDCDPGHDDLAAIVLAAASPSIKIEAITTVCGNASLENTTKNALRIVDAFGLDVPVYAGAAAPLLHRYPFPTEFHGPSGLDSHGLGLPATYRRAEHADAVSEIIRRVDERPGEITLIVIGPMTNIGLALALRPDLARKVECIAFMGGSTEAGNSTPVSEFNIWADPEAAHIVLQSGAPLVMFGLNVTRQTLLKRDDIATIRAAVGGPSALADILEYYCATYYAFAGDSVAGSPLHDPCPVAYLVDPTIFEIARHPVEVIVSRGSAYGQTLADLRIQDPKQDQRTRNVAIAVAASQEKFSALVLPALIWGAKRLGNAVPGNQARINSK